MSFREIWTALHGMIFGAAFLMAFAGGFITLWGLRAEWLRAEGARHAARRLMIWSWSMTALAWVTAILGTYLVYPWYRAKPLPNTNPLVLTHYPRYLLLSNPRTAHWHEFGMEWKEHVGWFTPILVTPVAFAVMYYREQIATDSYMRRALLMLYGLAFVAASIAGLLGALINKVAPVR